MTDQHPISAPGVADDEPMEATQQLIAEIHSEAQVEAHISEDQAFGESGPPFDRTSPGASKQPLTAPTATFRSPSAT